MEFHVFTKFPADAGTAIIFISLTASILDIRRHIPAGYMESQRTASYTDTDTIFNVIACAMGFHCTTIDIDCGRFAAANTYIIVAAFGCHIAAVDGHRTALAVVAATDAGALFAAGGFDGAAVDDHRAVVAFLAATDACAALAAGGGNGAAVNLDGAVATVFTAANACAILAAVGCDGAAVDGDGRIGIIMLTAADAGSTFLARSRDCTVVDSDARHAAALAVTTADARTVVFAGRGLDGTAVDNE